MSDDITGDKAKVEDTTTQTAPTEETNVDNSKLEENESKQPVETTQQEESIDYKAELEAAKAKTAKAEAKIVKMKKAGKKDDDEEDLEEDDVPDIEQLVAQQVKQQMSKVQLSTQQSLVDAEVGRVASNDDEAELIRHHLENTINLSGNIKDDIENAKFLANKKKILRDSTEMAAALRSQSTQGNAVSSGYKQAPEDTVKLNSRETKFLNAFGLSAKDVKK